jgi:hypothetical protein
VVRAPRVVTPMHAVLLSLFVFIATRVRFDRTAVGVALAALVVRLALAPRGVTNGALAGYEKLVLARGTVSDPPYGDGWGALMGGVPGWPDGVFWANLGFASASAGLLAAFVARVGGPAAGLAAGLFLALLPVHVGVSMSETMHVSVLAFELVAVLAAHAWGRSGVVRDGLIAALATGVAVHLRMDALAFAPVPLLWAALGAWGSPPEAGRRAAGWRRLVSVGAPTAVLAGLVGWRVATLGGGGDILRMPEAGVLLPRFGEPGAAHSFQLFLHAGLTPGVLWGFAAVGAAHLWRQGRRAELLALAAWIGLTTLPVSAKVMPLVDAVRLQLTGQAPWLALAGLGVAALPRWLGPLALLAFLPYFPLRPWVQTEEWAFLRSVVPTLPEGTTVRYDPRPQRVGSFVAVVERMGPATWSPRAGALRYVGVDCLDRGGCDTSGCVASRVTTLEGRVDVDLSLASRTIGFWECPAVGAPAEGAAPESVK